jgi:hypothetical protein
MVRLSLSNKPCYAGSQDKDGCILLFSLIFEIGFQVVYKLAGATA